jgi:hypothetical protein
MKIFKVTAGILVGLVLMFTLGYFLMKWSAQNQNNNLKLLIAGQQESNKANYDKMKKTIEQTAQTANAKFVMSKEAYKEIYPALMDGRYKDDKNSMMKLVVESNPTFDIAAAASLYDRLVVAIEANRQEFFDAQNKLISYNQEQRRLLVNRPTCWFLEKSDTIHITTITSKDTKEAFRTGEENDIDLSKTLKNQ